MYHYMFRFYLRLSQKSPWNGTNLQSHIVPRSTEMHIPLFSHGFRCAQKSVVLARTPWNWKINIVSHFEQHLHIISTNMIHCITLFDVLNLWLLSTIDVRETVKLCFQQIMLSFPISPFVKRCHWLKSLYDM